MAKKHEYPQNRHMLSRLEAINNGMIAVAVILRTVERHALPKMPEELRELVAQQLRDAKDALALARRAMSGDDDEE